MTDDLSIIILAWDSISGGVGNVLGSSFLSLKRALDKNKVSNYWATDYLKANNYYITIGFNAAGADILQDILNSGHHHIMWTVDSCFYQNFEMINQYLNYPNFHLGIITKTDIEPLNYFYPYFKNYHYLPHTVDSDLWTYNGQEKDLDIIYVASVVEPEKIIAETQGRLPGNLFDDFMDLFNYLKNNPHADLWAIYKEAFLSQITDVDIMQHAHVFHYFYKQITYLLSYTKRIELAKSMESVGIKIWGTPEWQKYVSGKNEYMGSINYEELQQIAPRAKVALNLQPLQIIGGLHERILTSTLSDCAILCDAAPEIKSIFGETLTYFDVKNFTNIKQKALTLLSNRDLRDHKIQKAKEIVLKDYTYDSSVERIASIKNTIEATNTRKV